VFSPLAIVPLLIGHWTAVAERRLRRRADALEIIELRIRSNN
jgi:hypothetical protein